MNQFNDKSSGAARSENGRAQMPRGIQSSHALESEYVTMRFQTSLVDGAQILTKLYVEVKHPKVSDDSRIFDLSHILAEGYRRAPSTVAQIVDPRLSLDTRLDALKTVAEEIARVRSPLPHIGDIEDEATESSTIDPLEPTFAIRNVVLTEFSDLLRGISRRAVTVVRNEEPWVRFSITEVSGSLRDAWLVILPAGLELPLLDRVGLPVTKATLDGAVHDFTYLLRQRRYLAEHRALEALADEVKVRLKRNPNPPPSLKGRDFRSEIARANWNHLMWRGDINGERGYEGTGPGHYDLEARELPDGRFLWVGHRPQGAAWEIILVGESEEGAQFEVTLTHSPHIHKRAAWVVADCGYGSGWPQFTWLLELLRQDTSGDVRVVTAQGINTYPAAVATLMRDIAQAASIAGIERGMAEEESRRFTCYLPDMVADLVRGRSPFCSFIDSVHPAEQWCVQAFFDSDLKGSLYAVNALGGSVSVHDDRLDSSFEFRRARILEFFNLLSNHSGRLLYDSTHISGLGELRRNLPDGSWKDALAYAGASRGASIVWAALSREWGSLLDDSSKAVKWETQRLTEGLWAVSLCSPFGRTSWFPYLVTLKVDPAGVVEVLYSKGARGPLGGLLGRRVFDSSRRVLSDDVVSNIIHVIARGSKGTLGTKERMEFTNVTPTLRRTFLSSLRSFDPERKQHDLLARLWHVLRRMW